MDGCSDFELFYKKVCILSFHSASCSSFSLRNRLTNKCSSLRASYNYLNVKEYKSLNKSNELLKGIIGLSSAVIFSKLDSKQDDQ